jgi:hypothetical protein
MKPAIVLATVLTLVLAVASLTGERLAGAGAIVTSGVAGFADLHAGSLAVASLARDESWCSASWRVAGRSGCGWRCCWSAQRQRSCLRLRWPDCCQRTRRFLGHKSRPSRTSCPTNRRCRAVESSCRPTGTII